MKARFTLGIAAMALFLMPLVSQAQTDSIWPGDIDNNGIVNNFDLLYLGRAIGAQGPARTGASTLFSQQLVTPWTAIFYDSAHTNMAFADCNGDGIVSDSDELVIEQNYGLVHGSVRFDSGLYSTGDSNSPALYFASLQDTFAPGSNVTLYVTLGTPEIPVDSFFGIAFSVYYDTTIVNKNSVISKIDTRWLDSPGGALFLAHNYPDSGRIDIALTLQATSGGISNSTISGYGNIANLDFVIEDNVIGGILKLPIWSSQARMVNKNMQKLGLTTITDTLYIQDPAGINNVKANEAINLYPNPAKGQVYIDMHNITAHDISIFDMVGAEAIHYSPGMEGLLTVDVNNVASGLYMVKITTDSGVITKKIWIGQ